MAAKIAMLEVVVIVLLVLEKKEKKKTAQKERNIQPVSYTHLLPGTEKRRNQPVERVRVYRGTD